MYSVTCLQITLWCIVFLWRDTISLTFTGVGAIKLPTKLIQEQSGEEPTEAETIILIPEKEGQNDFSSQSTTAFTSSVTAADVATAHHSVISETESTTTESFLATHHQPDNKGEDTGDITTLVKTLQLQLKESQTTHATTR